MENVVDCDEHDTTASKTLHFRTSQITCLLRCDAGASILAEFMLISVVALETLLVVLRMALIARPKKGRYPVSNDKEVSVNLGYTKDATAADLKNGIVEKTVHQTMVVVVQVLAKASCRNVECARIHRVRMDEETKEMR